MKAALNVVQHSALAGFDPDAVTVAQFQRLEAPFSTKSERRHARAVCTAIALHARIDTSRLSLSDLFVLCSIAVHRHEMRQKAPPAYSVSRHAML